MILFDLHDSEISTSWRVLPSSAPFILQGDLCFSCVCSEWSKQWLFTTETNEQNPASSLALWFLQVHLKCVWRQHGDAHGVKMMNWCNSQSLEPGKGLWSQKVSDLGSATPRASQEWPDWGGSLTDMLQEHCAVLRYNPASISIHDIFILADKNRRKKWPSLMGKGSNCSEPGGALTDPEMEHPGHQCMLIHVQVTEGK